MKHDVFRATFAILLGAFALLLPGCGEQFPTYRYRLTVEVETPEGLRTGSSVIEVRTRPSGTLHPGGIVSRVRGEAVAVDLGARGILFALLSSEDDPDNAAGIAPSALLTERPDQRGTAEAWGNNLAALRRVAGAAPVPESEYPMLVRFGDVRNSLTVTQVDPRNLAASFGPGVRLARITAQISDDPVTFGLDEYLPWVADIKERRLDPEFVRGLNPTLPQRLAHRDFLQD